MSCPIFVIKATDQVKGTRPVSIVATIAIAIRILLALITGETFAPCEIDEVEQATDCVWHATARGNGNGKSYVAIDGGVLTVPHHLAAHLTQ